MTGMHLGAAFSRMEAMVALHLLAQQLQQLQLLATGLKWQKVSLDPSPILPEYIEHQQSNTENAVCLQCCDDRMMMTIITLDNLNNSTT